ncbi:MAG: glycosyltransferase family 4 protein, partial [Chitinispirillaceae bacterium]|nr:glycosyltransferase family 4 protein [Chitinispirillaceae bacterium]
GISHQHAARRAPERRMNILLLNWRDRRHPQAGGAEIHYHEIFRRIAAKGHRVMLLTTRFPGSAPTDEHDGIAIYRYGNTWAFNLQAPFLTGAFLKKHRVDCVIDDVNKIPFFTPRWFPRLPCGVFFHHLFGRTIFDLTAWPMARYIQFLEDRCPWGYRGVPCCTVSNSTREELCGRGFDPAAITIIENSVDTGHLTPGDPAAREPDLLLYTGRLKRYKNVDILLEALRLLNERGTRLRLAIAGSGDDEPRLRNLAATLGLGVQVTFEGQVSEERKIDLYRRAAVFVNPSHKEGWGITSIEAGACGTAVVANDAPGLRDSVVNGKTGLLYRENDENDLAACIERLIGDPALRRSMEQAGRKWAQGFSWDSSARKMEEWLERIVLGGRGGRRG